MADERYRIAQDIAERGRADRLPTLTRTPISFFEWMLARVLAGDPIDIGEPQLRAFQAGFSPAEFDFSNLRRHLCIAASALLVGVPPGDSPAAALELAHRTWNGGRQDLETAVEGCGAAAAAGDCRELASWWERAQRQPPLDWVESLEETLFLLDPSRVELAPRALADSVARVAVGPLLYESTISAAPLVCALWHCSKARVPLRELLSGRVQEVDGVVFGSEGEQPRLKIGRLTHDVVETEQGPALVLTLKVTGRGPLSPSGYSLAALTYELGERLDRIRSRLSRLPEGPGKADQADAALVRSGHGVTLRVHLGRAVELSPADEQGFRARISHSWAHLQRSFREVYTDALVEFIR